jgi:hypothetical protein
MKNGNKKAPDVDVNKDHRTTGNDWARGTGRWDRQRILRNDYIGTKATGNKVYTKEFDK